jgi:glyoxylase-like metal-dependent hydrolase (beta-lactamase superfamily II)
MNIVNVGYDSTNYYVLGQRSPRLLVDVGWSNTLPKLQAALKRKTIALPEIGYLLVTHYHPDHAGLAQELKEQGVRLIVLEQQAGAIPVLKSYMKPVNRYVEIKLHDNITLSCDKSRAFLSSIGIAGQIIGTPGHSDDSVTLVLDTGAAFTGDLPPPNFAGDDSLADITRSWQHIREQGATMIYPGHGPVRPLD